MLHPLNPDTRVLVTGGSGYIGSRLVPALAAAGHAVTNVDPRAGGLGWVRADVRELPEDLPEFDCIVHLAGLAGAGNPTAAQLRAVNVDGTRAIMAHAASSGVRRVVLVSSISVLGPSELPLAEDATPNPVSDYGHSKLLAERIATRIAHEHGIQLVIIRPGYVFGPDHPGNFGRMVRAIKAGRFALPGREDTIKAGIYLPDVVDLMVKLVDHPEPPPLLHAVYPDTPTAIAWARTLHDHLAAERPVHTVPDPAVKVAMSATKAAAALTGSRRVREVVTTVGKLQESSNVISRVAPAAGITYRFGWTSAAEDLIRD